MDATKIEFDWPQFEFWQPVEVSCNFYVFYIKISKMKPQFLFGKYIYGKW